MTTLNEKIKSVNANLEVLQDELQILQDKLVIKVCDLNSVELDNDDFIEQYEDMLDEVEGEFMGMSASYILKECDPIAYRCGLNDYVDNQDVTDCQEYKDLEEEIEDLENSIEDLESEIESLEEEIAELEDQLSEV